MQQIENSTLQYDLIVGGLGPCGLDLALRAALAGKKVLAFTDRSDYIREQVLRLDKDIVELLFGNTKEKLNDVVARGIIEIKKDPGMAKDDFYVTIEMNKLEHFIYECQHLHHFENNIDLTVLQLPKANGNNNFHFDPEKQGIVIPEVRGKVFSPENDQEKRGDYYQNKLIKCRYFVATDGANHKMANQVNQMLAGQNQQAQTAIHYEGQQTVQLHEFHTAVVFKIPAALSKDISDALAKNNVAGGATESELRDQGWCWKSRPENRVLNSGDTVYIGTEAPKCILDIKDPTERNQEIEKWAKTVLRDRLPQNLIDQLRFDQEVDPDDEIDEKALLKQQFRISPFKIVLDEADVNFVPLWTKPTSDSLRERELRHKNTTYFFQSGDALRKPHYHTGSGAVTGMRINSAFIDYLKSDQTAADLDRYNERVNEIRASNRAKVDAYLLTRRGKEASARLTVLQDLYSSLNTFIRGRAFIAFLALLFSPFSKTAAMIRQQYVEALTFRALFKHKLDMIKEDIRDLKFDDAGRKVDELHIDANVWKAQDLERETRVKPVSHRTVQLSSPLHNGFFSKCHNRFEEFREDNDLAMVELARA